MEDGWGGQGAGMTPGRMTPGRSPGGSYTLNVSPSQLASPVGQSPFSDAIMFSPMDGAMFSPVTSPGYR